MDIYFLQLTPQHYIHGSIEALKRYHRGQAITRCSGRAGRACSFEPEDVQDVRVRPSLCLRAGAAMQSAGDADALLPASFDGTLLLPGFQVAWARFATCLSRFAPSSSSNKTEQQQHEQDTETTVYRTRIRFDPCSALLVSR